MAKALSRSTARKSNRRKPAAKPAAASSTDIPLTPAELFKPSPDTETYFPEPTLTELRVASILTGGQLERLKLSAIAHEPEREQLIDELGAAHSALLNACIAAARGRKLEIDAAVAERHAAAMMRAIRLIKSDTKRFTTGNGLVQLIELAQEEREWAQEFLRADARWPHDPRWIGDASREPAAPIPAANQDDAEAPWPPDDGWHFLPGLFYFRRRRYDLTGLPLKLLRMFVASRHASLTAAELYGAWPENTPLGPENLRPHLTKLRAALRTVAADIEAAADIADDPIPSKGGGWQFLLPKR